MGSVEKAVPRTTRRWGRRERDISALDHAGLCPWGSIRQCGKGCAQDRVGLCQWGRRGQVVLGAM